MQKWWYALPVCRKEGSLSLTGTGRAVGSGGGAARLRAPPSPRTEGGGATGGGARGGGARGGCATAGGDRGGGGGGSSAAAGRARSALPIGLGGGVEVG